MCLAQARSSSWRLACSCLSISAGWSARGSSARTRGSGSRLVLDELRVVPGDLHSRRRAVDGHDADRRAPSQASTRDPARLGPARCPARSNGWCAGCGALPSQRCPWRSSRQRSLSAGIPPRCCASSCPRRPPAATARRSGCGDARAGYRPQEPLSAATQQALRTLEWSAAVNLSICGPQARVRVTRPKADHVSARARAGFMPLRQLHCMPWARPFAGLGHAEHRATTVAGQQPPQPPEP